MTRNVFWDQPYQDRLDTRVTSVDGATVTVAETIFYALSGGQESDHGFFGPYPVLRAEKAEPDILYTLPEDHGLQPGDAVTITLDWPRRYRLMRLHFAAEVVLELVCQRWPEIEKIGAHIAVSKARIDFRWPESLGPHLDALSRQAQQLIDADRPIISDFSDAGAGRRYWRVEGFAQVPCGGTHLRRTGEVGALRLKRKTLGKGKERVEIYLQD